MKKLILLSMLFIHFGFFDIQTIQADEPASTIERLENQDKKIDAIKTDLDFVWVIISTALVFFMQAGFMALEAGMARSKNSINVAIKNLTDFVLGVIGFWIVGFGIMFGKSKLGFFGTTDFVISIDDPWIAAFFIFQAVFVGTAATIDSGAVCERAKLKQYILLSLLMSVIIYPIFGHWAWGSFLHGTDPLTGGAGWLERLGFKDFAGSSVVHSVGGWMALAGITIVGPRLGKFDIDKKTGKKLNARTFQPGDMRYVFLGTFILFFGWFGFNCGSTLSATPDIAGIAVNTTIAACFGCLVSSLISWVSNPEHKIEGGMIANGVLGGLVGITAGCAYVNTIGAALIGTVSGVVVFFGSRFIENVLKLDDVVDAVPVHGICGAWGTIAVGIFIRPDFLGGMTRLQQLGVQSLGALTCFGWAFGLGLLFYFLVDKFLGGVRVKKEDELIGLNVAEHGATSSLLELANSMNDLTLSGNFEDHQGITVDYGTEVGDLAAIFNKMIFRISSALKDSREQKQKAENMLEESRKQHKKAVEAEKKLEQNQQIADEKRKSYIEKATSLIGMVIEKSSDIKEKMENTNEITDQMNHSFEDLLDVLQRMLKSLSGIYTQMEEVGAVTDNASEVSGGARLSIDELSGITGEITEMINFINEIAERTHVLSINTAIEAARSSMSVKGFTVISKEVQQLSRQTSDAVLTIGNKVKGIELRVGKVISSMDEITGIVEKIGNLNKNVLTIVEENAEYTASLEKTSHATQAAVEKVRADINDMTKEVEKVSTMGEEVKTGLNAME